MVLGGRSCRSCLKKPGSTKVLATLAGPESCEASERSRSIGGLNVKITPYAGSQKEVCRFVKKADIGR
jgi:hypothetical protein